MPAELFVDTSAWYPLVVRKHPDHARLAAALQKRVAAGARVVTTNLVLAESHALIMARTRAATALAFLERVRQPPNRVVHCTAELEQRAIDGWLARFADHDFSLADAVSFEVMAERRIREALTLDRHFAAAGFTVVGG